MAGLAGNGARTVSSVKQAVKRALFALVGKNPESVVVNFATGPADGVRAMVAESRKLIPDRRHLLAGIDPPEIEGVTAVRLKAGGTLSLLWQLWRALKSCRVGMAPVLFGSPHPLRRAAMLYSPSKILAFNSRLECHHLKPSTLVSSLLFASGVPLDRIHLRPRGLQWLTFDRSVIPTETSVVEGRKPRKGTRRVAVLTPFAPYPLSHGGAVRLFNLLREMAAEFDVYLFYFRETPAELAPLLEFLTAVAWVDKPRYREPRWSTWLPPEVREYESPPMRALLERMIKQHSIDLLQVEYTQLARYSGDILVEHDVTFDLYRQVRERQPGLASWWNWKRWHAFETAAVAHFRRVITMSEKDAGLLGVAHARTVPNGVDLARFLPSPELPGQRLLFLGSFRHFPNVTAFRFLIDQVWPLLCQSHPQALLHVVAGPDAESYCQLPRHPRIRIEGFVADVRPAYHSANVVLVPTLVSAGTNVKVLEAMAMKRAIVSTTSGVGGLAVEHGRHVLIADTAPQFAAAIAALLDDPPARVRMAEESYRLVTAEYGWSRLGEMQRAIVRELLPEPIAVRKGEARDIPHIRAIQAECLPTSRWDPEQYLRHELYTATCDHETAGFIVARRTAPDEREILNIAVRPQFRGRGIGEKLLLRLVTAAPGEVFLEVRESNAVARRLYERVGFRDVGKRANYYDDPPETAVIMRVHT